MNKNKNAFTLIEILIVVAIIGLLATMAVPAFRRAQQSARESAVRNNVRQLISAGQQYMLNENVTQVTYAQLTTPGANTLTDPAYLRTITPTAGESYAQTLSITGGTFAVSTGDGTVNLTFSY